LLSRLGTELGLALGIRNALFRRHLLDDRRAPRESPKHILRNARYLEIIPLSFNAETQILQAIRQAHTERRLKIRGVPFDFTELCCFPPVFFLIPGGVENEAVSM